MPKSLFYTFDIQPPNAHECMLKIYEAFADYKPAVERAQYCTTCTRDDFIETIAKASKSPHTAPMNSFCGIYWENPTCMGGADNIKFWLPHTIETYMLTSLQHMPYSGIHEIYQNLGLSAWPDHEQEVLRLTFSRALINLIETGDPSPLKGELLDNQDDRRLALLHISDIFVIIIATLIYLHVEPTSIFKYLLNNDDARVDFFLCSEINYPWLSMEHLDRFSEQIYINNDDLKHVTEILSKRARVSLFQLISSDDLQQLLEKYKAKGDEILCCQIKHALQQYEQQKIIQDDKDQIADERTLRHLLQKFPCEKDLSA